MAEIVVIYDSSLSPNAVNVSNTFTNGKYIYFTSSSIEQDQVLEIGVSCVVRVETVNGIVDKNWTNLGTLTTDTIIPIPDEVSNVALEFYLAFGVSDTVSNFRAYVITSDSTLENIESKLEDIKAIVEGIDSKTNELILADLLQNTALTILGTGLIPITGGVTSAIPLLFPSSLLPVLLPG